jgi:hypothetical protein
MHCFHTFNKRYVEMDGPLSRLAFFLDPRFKSAADPYGKNFYPVILEEVCTFASCPPTISG